MRSLIKADLNHSEEIYRLLGTMVKKLKMSKKEASIILTETTADIVWLNKLKDQGMKKYSVVLNNEEVAKVIFYIREERNEVVLHVYDLYVTPRYRKQKLAKALLIEMLSDYRVVPRLSFHTRESNKPVHNLVQYFIKGYNLPESDGIPKLTEHFYVDGANAVIYEMQNPAWALSQEVNEPHKGVAPETIEGAESHE